MKKFEDVILDEAGNIVAGAELYVRNNTTPFALVALYSDNGSTTTANPVVSGSDGYVRFFTADNTLKLEVYVDGELERTITDYQHYDNLDNEIKALRSVTSAANKGFYFTGSGTGAVYDLTSVGRSFGALTDPNADRIAFWDDSADGVAWLVPGTGISISTTNLNLDSALTNIVSGDYSGLKPTESLVIACSDETTALTAGTGKVTFRMPYAFTVTAVRASLTTAQSSGNIFTVDINEAGTTIISTKLTIDNNEKTSTTAATPAVISDASLADDAEMSIDIDQIGDGTAKGLKVVLIGHRT